MAADEATTTSGTSGTSEPVESSEEPPATTTAEPTESTDAPVEAEGKAKRNSYIPAKPGGQKRLTLSGAFPFFSLIHGERLRCDSDFNQEVLFRKERPAFLAKY